jgi:glutathione synthase/RimK-type ligase-like ATP-grasp enzyme
MPTRKKIPLQRVYCLNTRPRAYAISRLREEAEKLGLTWIDWHPRQTSFCYRKGKLELWIGDEPFLPQGSGVILRNISRPGHLLPLAAPLDPSLYTVITLFLKQHKIPALNTECLLRFPLWEDKLVQMVFFATQKIPFIAPSYHFHQRRLATKILSQATYPLLRKPRWGSWGRGIARLENFRQLEKFWQRYQAKQILVQRWVENRFDIRVFATPEKIIGSIKRTRTRGIINNISAGGIAEKYHLTSKRWRDYCRRLCRLLLADYLVLDIIFEEGTGKGFFLEANRFGQFRGFEQATGINMAKTLLLLLLKKAKRLS